MGPSEEHAPDDGERKRMESESLEFLLTSLVETESKFKVASVSVQDSSDEWKAGGSTGQLKAQVCLSNGETRRLFMKLNTKGSQADAVDKLFQIVERETLMYSTFLPALREHQLWKSGKESLSDIFLKFYGSDRVGDTFYLVFEDISENDYIVTSKTDLHTTQQVELALSKIGVYHAISFAWTREEKGKELLDKSPVLQIKPFSPAYKPWTDWGGYVSQLMRLYKVLLKQQQAGNGELKKSDLEINLTEDQLNHLELQTNTSMSLMANLEMETPSSLGVVVHGDFHMWNMGFNNKDSLKLFDLQICRHSSPMVDLHQYLSQVTSAPDRSKNLGRWLDIYLDAFNSTLKDVECDTVPFSKETLLSEYQRMAPYGFIYGTRWNLRRFVEDEKMFDKCWASLSEEPAEVLDGESLVELLDKAGTQIWSALHLIAGILDEAIRNNTFP